MSVKHGLLALLGEGPRHGYQLKAEFEQSTGGVWHLNVGQVYTTLERLERDGLVAETPSSGGRGQRTFKITAAGRRELAAWFAAGPADDGPPRDELLVKVLLAVRQGSDVLAVIDRQRAALLATYQAHRRRDPGDDVAADLVHDALAERIEADLRWLDRCEATLKERAR